MDLINYQENFLNKKILESLKKEVAKVFKKQTNFIQKVNSTAYPTKTKEEKYERKRIYFFKEEKLACQYMGIGLANFEGLQELMLIVENSLNEKFDFIQINLYEDKEKFIDWHSDDNPLFDMNKSIGLLSLGDERTLSVREILDINKQRSYKMKDNSFLEMRAGSQLIYEHRLEPAEEFKGPRMSLVFRSLVSQD